MRLVNQSVQVSKRIVGLSLGVTLATLTTTGLAHAATVSGNVTVSGQANPWLAGMPTGSKAQAGDKAFTTTKPNQSPVQISLLSGLVREFTFTSVTGAVGNSSIGNQKSADGTSGSVTHRYGAENGISGAIAPQNALVGVFLGDDAPNLTGAPIAVDYNATVRNQAEFSPLLKQVFFIGDGRNNLGELQKFFAPKGATRLFLGTMDAYKWNDNTGSFQVSFTQKSVPEPATAIGTLAFGALGSGAWLKRKKNNYTFRL